MERLMKQNKSYTKKLVEIFNIVDSADPQLAGGKQD
jgi:hypothetical protein